MHRSSFYALVFAVAAGALTLVSDPPRSFVEAASDPIATTTED